MLVQWATVLQEQLWPSEAGEAKWLGCTPCRAALQCGGDHAALLLCSKLDGLGCENLIY